MRVVLYTLSSELISFTIPYVYLMYLKRFGKGVIKLYWVRTRPRIVNFYKKKYVQTLSFTVTYGWTHERQTGMTTRVTFLNILLRNSKAALYLLKSNIEAKYKFYNFPQI